MKNRKLAASLCSGITIAAMLLAGGMKLHAGGVFSYDVNCDGKVDILDMICLKSFMLDSDGPQTVPTPVPSHGKDYIISVDYIDAINKISEDDVEIEKKWLIDPEKMPFDLSKVEHVIQIEQTYLCFSPEMRVRRYDDGKSFEYTVKSNMTSDGMIRDENNIDISEEEYNDLIRKKEGNTINKTRYQFLFQGELIAIDIFHGDLDGLAYMEIEFVSKKDADEYQTPDWVIADVTSDIRYKNGHLARYGIPVRE